VSCAWRLVLWQAAGRREARGSTEVAGMGAPWAVLSLLRTIVVLCRREVYCVRTRSAAGLLVPAARCALVLSLVLLVLTKYALEKISRGLLSTGPPRPHGTPRPPLRSYCLLYVGSGGCKCRSSRFTYLIYVKLRYAPQSEWVSGTKQFMHRGQLLDRNLISTRVSDSEQEWIFLLQKIRIFFNNSTSLLRAFLQHHAESDHCHRFKQFFFAICSTQLAMNSCHLCLAIEHVYN
jgi:hypothetical protein